MQLSCKETSTLPQMNKDACDFGKCLSSDKSQIFYNVKDFKELHKMHDNLHQYAEEMLRKETDLSKMKELKNLSVKLLEKMCSFVEYEEL